MKLKTTLSLLALASCAAISTSALAQSTGTLNIKGYVSPVSCTPQLTGSAISGNTLTMPDAFINDLATPGSSTGETPFTFELTGCTTSGTINNMWVHFSGTGIDGAGRLTTGNSNLRFELLNSPGSGTLIVAGGTAAATGPTATQGTSAAFTGTNPNRAASKTYAVRYYAQNAVTAADIGPVNAAVTYTVQYF